MEVDGTLVMSNFLEMMGNFFGILGFATIITLCATGAYIYIVHHRGDGYYGD